VLSKNEVYNLNDFQQKLFGVFITVPLFFVGVFT
jgi:hypothetical protein